MFPAPNVVVSPRAAGSALDVCSFVGAASWGNRCRICFPTRFQADSSHLLHIHNAISSTLRNAADAVGARSRLEGLEGCKHAALRGDLVGTLSSMRHIALPCFNILSCARIICEAMDAQW
jgi:hypothetical protein